MIVKFICNLDKFRNIDKSRKYDFRPMVGDLVVINNVELEVVAIRYNIDCQEIEVELHIPRKFSVNEDFVKKVYF